MEEKMSLPTAFEEKMKRLIGDEYSEYLKCFDEPRHYGLRVNTSKISTEDFLKIAPWPLEPVPWIHNGFYYDGENCHPARHPYYFAGLYYLQEPSAMTGFPYAPETGYSTYVQRREEKRRNWEPD